MLRDGRGEGAKSGRGTIAGIFLSSRSNQGEIHIALGL